MSKMISNMTYKLQETGGVLRSDGASIPDSVNNRDWVEYQERLAEGYEPEPAYTPEEIVENVRRVEVDDLKASLRRADIWHFRMLIEVFKLLKQFTACKNSDVDPVLLQKATQWITKLDRLQEIDE